MRLLITPMRRAGVSLSRQAIQPTIPIWGDIVVAHEHPEFLGRYSDVASVAPAAAGQPAPLPSLYDVRLSWMATGGFVLSGIERRGAVAFAQAWWCRPK